MCNHCRRYFLNTIPRCEYEPQIPTCSSSDSGYSSEPPTLVISSGAKALPSQMKVFAKSLSFPKMLGLQKLDPFDTHQASIFTAADMLRHHCKQHNFQLYINGAVLAIPWYSILTFAIPDLTVIRAKCLPIGFKLENNPIAILFWDVIQRDTLLDSVALQVAAVDLESAKEKPNAHSSNALSKESLRILRERLEDPVSGISDATIAAVSMLAVIEVS